MKPSVFVCRHPLLVASMFNKQLFCSLKNVRTLTANCIVTTSGDSLLHRWLSCSAATNRRQEGRLLGRRFPRQPSRAAHLWPLLDAAAVIALNYTASHRRVSPRRGTSALVNPPGCESSPGGPPEAATETLTATLSSCSYTASESEWEWESESFINYQGKLLVALQHYS